MVVENGAELVGSYVVTVTELVPGVSPIDGAFTIEGCHFTEMEGDIIFLDSNTLNVVLEGSGFVDLTEGTLLIIGQEYVGIQRLDSNPSSGISTVVLDSPLSSDLRAVESVQYCAMARRSVAHNATVLDVQTALSHVFEEDTEIVVTHASSGYHGASSWCVTFPSDLGDVPRLNVLPGDLRHASRATVVEKVQGNSLQGSFVLLFESGGLQSSGLIPFNAHPETLDRLLEDMPNIGSVRVARSERARSAHGFFAWDVVFDTNHGDVPTLIPSFLIPQSTLSMFLWRRHPTTTVPAG
jgi:hypothetical protein